MSLLGKNLFQSSRNLRTCEYKCGNACSHAPENTSTNTYFGDLFANAANAQINRRTTLKGAGSAALVLGGSSLLAACSSDSGSSSGSSAAAASSSGSSSASTDVPNGLKFEAVAANTEDKVVIPAGYDQKVVIRWGDPVIDGAPEFDVDKQTPDAQAKQFGFNNDFAALLPIKGEDNKYLFVSNHEYTTPQMMFPGYDEEKPTEEQVRIEWVAHGLSIVEVEGNDKDGSLKPVMGKYNRRLTGLTEFQLAGPVAGSDLAKTAADSTGKKVLGTLNNCSGGVTPWGTILSGEENVDQYFANVDKITDEALKTKLERYGLQEGATTRKWEDFDDRFDVSKTPNEPNRFNYVVEINPWDPTSTPVKHTAMGRFKHEGANIFKASDGTIVAYSGDDSRFEYIYKFVSSKKMVEGDTDEARKENMTILDQGTLYVGTFKGNSESEIDGSGQLPKDGKFDGTGEWKKLATIKADGTGESHVDGMSLEEVLVYTRIAGDKVGATKMDRPEDVDVHPTTGKIYAALTNNKYRGANREGKKDEPVHEVAPIKEDKNGLVLELTENSANHTGEDFTWDLLLVCGDPNAAYTYFGGFDKKKVSPISCPDNLCFDSFGNLWISTDGNALKSNDGLFAVSLEGDTRGLTTQFLTVPIGAETCGPIVTDKRVMVNVQHPGEDDDATIKDTKSHWPDGGNSVPRPAAVAVWKTGGGAPGS